MRDISHLLSSLKRKWSAAAALMLLAFSASSQTTAPAAAANPPITSATDTAVSVNQVLATGPNGVVIHSADVLAEVSRLPEVTRKAFLGQPDSVQQLTSNLLVRRILAKEAARDGLEKDPLVAASVNIARDRVLSDARLANLDTQNAPSEAALEAYARSLYQAEPSKFEQPAQTRVRHILIPNAGLASLEKAKELLSQLRGGASFEDLAKANSSDTVSAANGGDLGFFSDGKMVRPFEDAVNKLAKPGDLSEPVETQFGYHIIRLEERRAKGRQSFEEVRPKLKAEARTAILNEARVTKVQSMNKDLVFNQDAIKAIGQSAGR